MKSKENYIIEECRYCGNKTKMDIVGHYIEHNNGYDDISYNIDWLMLKCSACNQITLSQIYEGQDTQYMTEFGEIDYDEIYTTKFPVETYQAINVPKNVNNAFSSALKAQHVDDVICLIALRRTLEIICKYKEAEGKNLEKKILDLTNKCIFPKIINEASDILRILGNEAAHGDDIKYDWAVIKEMINFTQIIIEYVYIIPYRIEKIKTKLSKNTH